MDAALRALPGQRAMASARPMYLGKKMLVIRKQAAPMPPGKSLEASLVTRCSSSGSPSRAPKDFSLRSQAPPASAAVTSPPAPSPPSILERKKVAQEAPEEGAEAGSQKFRVVQVDSAVVEDFYKAPVLAVADVAPGWRCVTVEAEVSREFVPLEKAYTKPGQAVTVRMPGHADSALVHVSSGPFSGETNFGVLYKLKGDITAGSTKAPQYGLSVRAPLDLHVSASTHPELFRLAPGDEVEVGEFTTTGGLDLRPILFLSRFPTVLLFASGPGPGVAAVRALIEAEDVGSLYLSLRADVRLYYSAARADELAYKEQFEEWERLNVKVRPVVRNADGEWRGLVGDFASAFDEDDLEYDPETTAAVVCGDEISNAAALRVLEAAGVPQSSILVWDSSSIEG